MLIPTAARCRPANRCEMCSRIGHTKRLVSSGPHRKRSSSRRPNAMLVQHINPITGEAEWLSVDPGMSIVHWEGGPCRRWPGAHAVMRHLAYCYHVPPHYRCARWHRSALTATLPAGCGKGGDASLQFAPGGPALPCPEPLTSCISACRLWRRGRGRLFGPGGGLILSRHADRRAEEPGVPHGARGSCTAGEHSARYW